MHRWRCFLKNVDIELATHANSVATKPRTRCWCRVNNPRQKNNINQVSSLQVRLNRSKHKELSTHQCDLLSAWSQCKCLLIACIDLAVSCARFYTNSIATKWLRQMEWNACEEGKSQNSFIKVDWVIGRCDGQDKSLIKTNHHVWRGLQEQWWRLSRPQTQLKELISKQIKTNWKRQSKWKTIAKGSPNCKRSRRRINVE